MATSKHWGKCDVDILKRIIRDEMKKYGHVDFNLCYAAFKNSGRTKGAIDTKIYSLGMDVKRATNYKSSKPEAKATGSKKELIHSDGRKVNYT